MLGTKVGAGDQGVSVGDYVCTHVCLGGVCRWTCTHKGACGEHTEHGPYPTASQSPEGEYPSENICELKSCCCTCLPCKEREGGRGRGRG